MDDKLLGIVISVRPVQVLNAAAPILLILSVIVMLERLEQW